MAWSKRQLRIVGIAEIIVGIVAGLVTLMRRPFQPFEALLAALIILIGVSFLKRARAESGG